MSRLRSLPIEIYKEILFRLDSQSLINISQTETYNKNLCNEVFFEEYIMDNYDSNLFKLPSWNDLFDNKIPNKIISRNNKISTWKALFKKICQNQSISTILYDKIKGENKSVGDINLDINFIDTGSKILSRIENLLVDNFINFDSYSIDLFFKDGVVSAYSPKDKEMIIHDYNDQGFIEEIYASNDDILGIINIKDTSLYDLIESIEVTYESIEDESIEDEFNF